MEKEKRKMKLAAWLAMTRYSIDYFDMFQFHFFPGALGEVEGMQYFGMPTREGTCPGVA